MAETRCHLHARAFISLLLLLRCRGPHPATVCAQDEGERAFLHMAPRLVRSRAMCVNLALYRSPPQQTTPHGLLLCAYVCCGRRRTRKAHEGGVNGASPTPRPGRAPASEGKAKPSHGRMDAVEAAACLVFQSIAALVMALRCLQLWPWPGEARREVLDAVLERLGLASKVTVAVLVRAQS